MSSTPRDSGRRSGPAGSATSRSAPVNHRRGIRAWAKGRPAVLTGLAPGEWWVRACAAELGMPTASIYNWIYRGWITARHAPGTRNWIITADEEQMRRLRQRRARPPGYYTRARWTARTGTGTRPETRTDHEKAAQLDRCQRWPTSTGHLSPADLMSRVFDACWPSGTKQ